VKVKVIREYISEFSNPLKLRKGDIVVIDHSKDKHAGWKFGKINNNEGWIPKEATEHYIFFNFFLYNYFINFTYFYYAFNSSPKRTNIYSSGYVFKY